MAVITRPCLRMKTIKLGSWVTLSSFHICLRQTSFLGCCHTLFIITKAWKQPKCLWSDKWIKKMWYIHTTENYLTLEKWNTIFSNKEGPRDYHTKWRKSEKEIQIVYDITYMWSLKYDKNELIYKTETDLKMYRTELWLPRRWGWVRNGLEGLANANYNI